MIHIDLFAGIGGNSYAFDKIFHEQKNTHIFCEIDPFPQAVLKKHWPEAEIFGDIRSFANPRSFKPRGISDHAGKKIPQTWIGDHPFLLTGGFPCQPFSQAGRRKGTEDDRYLWPAMLRVIHDWKPTWVIAENVRGLVTWNDGMVLETVCSDLEREGYEVQPLIIPAVAVGAPHRRDRIWFVAHRKEHDARRKLSDMENSNVKDDRSKKSGKKEARQFGDSYNDAPSSQNAEHESTRDTKRRGADQRTSARASGSDTNDPNSISSRLERGESQERSGHSGQLDRDGSAQRTGWEQNWHEVATVLCRMDDGLSAQMDGVTLSPSAHRKARLKALGNAIVPQVAMEIMKAIKQTL